MKGSKEEVEALERNDPIVAAAMGLWRRGYVDEVGALRIAVVALAEDRERIAKQLAEAQILPPFIVLDQDGESRS